jgi:hypothetical protein
MMIIPNLDVAITVKRSFKDDPRPVLVVVGELEKAFWELGPKAKAWLIVRDSAR